MEDRDLPPLMSDEEAERIISRLYSRASLPDDQERLVKGYMRLVFAIACKISRHKSTQQDVFQAGCVELTEVVNDIFSFKKLMYDEQVYRVINKNVSHRCKDYVEDSRTTRMPGRTIRHYMLNGLNPDGKIIDDFNGLSPEARLIIQLLPPIYQMDFIDIAKKVDLNELRRQVKTKLFSLIKIPKFSNDDPVEDVQATLTDVSLDMKEMLSKAISNFREQNIIELRAEGYTYEEIGQKLHMSTAQVGVYVQRVEYRFEMISKNVDWSHRRTRLN